LKQTTAPGFAGAAETCPDRSQGAGAGAVLLLIRAYKALLSPLFAGSCRFVPSCATYMAEAVEGHGAVRGVLLGMRRLARCHPFCEAGYDPVPSQCDAGWLIRGGRCAVRDHERGDGDGAERPGASVGVRAKVAPGCVSSAPPVVDVIGSRGPDGEVG
jgi:hypothetical protein